MSDYHIIYDSTHFHSPVLSDLPPLGIRFISGSPRVNGSTVQADFILTRPAYSIICQISRHRELNCECNGLWHTMYYYLTCMDGKIPGGCRPQSSIPTRPWWITLFFLPIILFFYSWKSYLLFFSFYLLFFLLYLLFSFELQLESTTRGISNNY